MMRVSRGLSGVLTHMNFSRSDRISAVRGHCLRTVHVPLPEIPSRPRIMLTGTVRRASWVLELPHLCGPMLSCISVNGFEFVRRALTMQVVCTSARIGAQVMGLARPR